MNALAKIKAESNFTIFKFGSHEIRVINKDGEPWFVAHDVCSALEIQNITQAIERLDDDERSMFNIGHQDDINVVSESGMYTLVLRCRDAIKQGSIPHRFRKWVTNEVLPSIRKVGNYHSPKIITDEHTLLRDAVNMLVGKRGMMCSEAYSFIHQRFNISHIDQLPMDKITEAIEYVHKLVLEDESIGKAELPALEIKQYKQQFTDDELCSLCWLWRDAVEMISSISDVYPILRAAEHRLEGKYYSMSHEYPRNMNIVRRLLERETAHIECASFTGSDWRVLNSLRFGNLPF
ncbi:hypothetical protein AA106_16250 [Photorhabdus laumondii subsp. laumondii]|uniref:P22AR C-terminal domain-containing protein n=1 Tax=Photorhabdus laumondii TaxID=2218628 RepID=UPI0007337715|nr:P22AR C-terminal domain-containing protein [Photorhabdus laumondii]KTL59689.1 hypothetical protein AA106_16250 [Photorhabdus laumondii subsp. laumondii]